MFYCCYALCAFIFVLDTRPWQELLLGGSTYHFRPLRMTHDDDDKADDAEWLECLEYRMMARTARTCSC